MAAGLAACGTAGGPGGITGSIAGHGGFTIGLLFPETHNPRWATSDKPLIERKIKELCPVCTVMYANASADVATQQQQVDSMIANGVRVLILAPVDYKAIRTSVLKAHEARIPVVAYDRLAEGPISAYSSYDSVQIGRLQAQALLTAMGHKRHRPQIVMMNGDISDPNALALRKGALSVLEGKVRIGRSYYTDGWIPQNAYGNMSAAIAELGPGHIDGIISANDGIVSGILTALRAQGVEPAPPVTGQDADLAAVRRIVEGKQCVTVYKSFVSEATAAAEMAVALGRGQDVRTIAKDRITNGASQEIPAVLGPLVPVTRGTIKQTLVKNGVYTVGQICTPQLQAACRKAGLTN
jgi:D-xylose transport system substrate-binding protein